MNTLINITFFLTIFYLINCATVRYDNYQIHRIQIDVEENERIVQQFGKDPEFSSFWSPIRRTAHDVDVLVAPEIQRRFKNLINNFNLNSTILIENIQQLIDKERIATCRSSKFDWTAYHTLDKINDWLSDLSDKYRDKVTLLYAGETYEGRQIVGVKLSYNSKNENRSVFLEGNIHAREWISSAVVTYILNELLTSADPKVRVIAESNDWYVFPIVNPDGFVYTHTTNRLWRKTRVPYGECFGADPNRNWDYHFNDGGTSDAPCSEQYRGPYAFSEPSTKSLSKFLSNIGTKLRAYIGFHSYGQKLLIPYGYTSEHLDNFDDLLGVGETAINSLANRYGTQYETGNIVETLYIASGNSMDWVKGNFKTPITYTYELRDSGRYGFLLPADQILPTGEETLDSLVTIIEQFDQILDNST